MPLLLREDDVARVLPMDTLIAAVEDGFRLLGRQQALNRPRQRSTTKEGTVLHVMSAAIPALGVMGLKAYTSGRDGTRFMAMLYSTDTGELIAMMEANRLGQMRTGAASAVATKHMAKPDAGALGIIGTGWQARSQVIAASRVRPIALVKCYSRDARRREEFADEMIAELGAEVVAVRSAREAVEAVDIVATATTASEPVLLGEWLVPGMHVNAIGSNWTTRRELDAEAVRRCDRIAVDDVQQAREEAGDLVGASDAGLPVWDRVVELGRIVAGDTPGRAAPREITLFESQGIALEDVAAMKLAYDRARQLGVGEELRKDVGGVTWNSPCRWTRRSSVPVTRSASASWPTRPRRKAPPRDSTKLWADSSPPSSPRKSLTPSRLEQWWCTHTAGSLPSGSSSPGWALGPRSPSTISGRPPRR